MPTTNIHRSTNRTNPEEFFRYAGWVYVLGNEAMGSIYKIGSTTRSVERRMREMYTTGVPVPFDCIFGEWFSDCRAAERFIHSEMQEYRLDASREFFAADIDQIIHAFMACSAIGENVPDDILDIHIDLRHKAESREAVNGALVSRNARRGHSKIEAPF